MRRSEVKIGSAPKEIRNRLMAVLFVYGLFGESDRVCLECLSKRRACDFFRIERAISRLRLSINACATHSNLSVYFAQRIKGLMCNNRAGILLNIHLFKNDSTTADCDRILLHNES